MITGVAQNGKTYIEAPVDSYKAGDEVVTHTVDIVEAVEYSEDELAAMSPRQRRRTLSEGRVIGKKHFVITIEGMGQEFYCPVQKTDVCRYYGSEREERES